MNAQRFSGTAPQYARGHRSVELITPVLVPRQRAWVSYYEPLGARATVEIWLHELPTWLRPNSGRLVYAVGTSPARDGAA